MTSSQRSRSSRSRADRLLGWGLAACALAAGSVLVFVLAFLVREAWPALRGIPLARFAGGDGWLPSAGRYDLTPMIAGTVTTSAGALALAAPLGVLVAIFLRFLAPRPLARWTRAGLELLGGLPSVVFGLWGLVVLVPLVAGFGGSGQSLLAAALVLALMVLPTVALAADGALAAVPAPVLRGAAALGLDPWAVAWRVAVPAARGGIASGVVLALTRALGETMAVLLVAGNVVALPGSPLAPVRTLSANVALEMAYARGEHRGALFVSGLALTAAVGLAVAAAGRWRRRARA